MKKITILVVLLMLSVRWLNAQQWSDVGDPGFTTSPNPTLTLTNAYELAIVNNVPYVAFGNGTDNISVLKYSSGTWTSLPNPSAIGNSIGLSGDGAGNLYLVYSTSSLTVVTKKFNGTSWSTLSTFFPQGGTVATRVVINPATSEPTIASISSCGTCTNKVRTYRYSASAWTLIGAADFSAITSMVNLAIAPNGTPFVVFREGTSTTTFSVMKFDGTNWVSVGSAGFGNLSTSDLYTDIAVDAAGAPYVISKNISNGKASVMKHNGTAWITVGAVDFTPGGALFAKLKFDNSGTLHIVYRDLANNNRISAMKFNGSNWVQVGSVGFSGGAGQFPMINFDSNNVPFVLFRDATVTGSPGSVMKLCSSSLASVTSTTPASVCVSGQLTLSAVGSGTLRWYSDTNSGLYLGSGSTYITPNISTTTNYHVAAYDVNGCSSPRTAVVATVNAIPSITASTAGSRCGTGTVSLQATTSVGVINWFTASTGGSAIGTGSPFLTPSISNTTTYYAEANNSGCLSTSRIALVATINTVPSLGTGIGAFRCGTGSVTLSTSAFPSGATVTWFAASSGGSSLFTGDTFTTPSISNNTTFYAEANFNGCVSASRQGIIAEVRSIPSVTSSAGGETCNQGTINLNATTSAGSQPRWYNVATGGTSLSSSNNFTTPSISTTQTYYVEAMQNGCASTPRTAVIATIKPYPSLIVSDVSRCDAGSVSFEAASTGTVSWFAASTGGSSLAGGPIFTTPSISVSTPYFVESTLNGCTTPTRSQVQAIVIATPVQPTITQNNSNIDAPVLTSSASAGNQWYKNDAVIAGATNATYTITDAGSYKVQVNNSGCLSPFSALVNYVITGFEVANKDMLKLYPNPTSDELKVSLQGFESDRLVNVMVVDLMGRTLNQSTAFGGEEVSFKVSQFNAGHYLVLANQGNRRIVRSFIKSH